MKPDVPTQLAALTWFPLGSRRRRFASQADAKVPLEALTVTTSPEVPAKVQFAGTPAVEMVAVTVAPFAVIGPEFADATPALASRVPPSASNVVTATLVR